MKSSVFSLMILLTHCASTVAPSDSSTVDRNHVDQLGDPFVISDSQRITDLSNILGTYEGNEYFHITQTDAPAGSIRDSFGPTFVRVQQIASDRVQLTYSPEGDFVDAGVEPCTTVAVLLDGRLRIEPFMCPPSAFITFEQIYEGEVWFEGPHIVFRYTGYLRLRYALTEAGVREYQIWFESGFSGDRI